MRTITSVLDDPERTHIACSPVDSLAGRVLQVVDDCTVAGQVEGNRPGLVGLDLAVWVRVAQIVVLFPSCRLCKSRHLYYGLGPGE